MENERLSDRPDFYVRQNVQQLFGLKLELLHAQLDEYSDPIELDDIAGECLGYAEWVGGGTPVVSIGWDWVSAPEGSIRLLADSLRTNLMLVDEQGQDLGAEVTAAWILRRVSDMPWQQRVLAFLSSDR
jgi:hypothetical protein